VVEHLRRLRLEIDSIRTALRSDTHKLITNEETLERIRQLFLAWSSGVRPELATARVPPEVLNRPDGVLTELVRLTSRRSPKRRYLALLRFLRRTLIDQVLPEVARTSAPLRAPERAAAAARLIPEIPDLTNEFIPYALYGWIPNMKAFLKEYSFDRNVFIMVSYRKTLTPLITGIAKVLVEFGLNAIVARHHPLTDDLYNPIACLLCCNHGIAIFSRPEARQVHNPNVAYELGVMHLLKRPLLILKHKSVKRMPSDFLQKLYVNYGSLQEAIGAVREWANQLTHQTS